MVSEPEEWPAFASYLEDIKNLKEIFFSSEIIHVSRMQNTKTNTLGRPSTQCQETTVFRRPHECEALNLVFRVSMGLF